LNGAPFSSYGSEKKGSLVRSFVRLGPAERPIRDSSPVERPDAIVVFHAALLRSPATLAGLRRDGTFIFNAPPGVVPEELAALPRTARVIRVNALGIALEEKSRPNAVLLGALSGQFPFLDATKILAALSEEFAARHPEAVASNERAFKRGATDFEVITREMIERIAEVEGGLEEETTYDGRKLRWTEEARKGLWTMKNAYLRRRVKARVEKSARMKRLDTITLDFARQVIEEETGSPLDIKAPAAARSASARPGEAGPEEMTSNGAGSEAKLIARDERKNPLISTFDWTDDAVQRVFRVPAGFMRNKTQERVEELARERAVAAIDLALVEDGIEFGKKMMAEMIANYSAPSTSSSKEGASPVVATPAPAQEAPSGGDYLNEVRSMSATPRQG